MWEGIRAEVCVSFRAPPFVPRPRRPWNGLATEWLGDPRESPPGLYPLH